MKTNQIMIRDNELFIQRTKDAYFNANALARAKGKTISFYQRNEATKNFIKHLKAEGIEKPYISSRSGTWMHPKLFIDFAMWVSVEFKSIVIDYVLDGLMKSRNDAGDYYNQMCATIMSTHIAYFGTKPPPTLYQSEAIRMKVLLGIDKDRNELSEEELSHITSMQKYNVLLLNKRVGLASRIRRLSEHAELLHQK